MSEPPQPRRAQRWVERRIQRTDLRPRSAAILIVGVWSFCVVVFGVVEHLVDPDTFDTVWLGMWWAVQTVTTVGYGDVVPQDTVGQVMGTVLMLGGLSLIAVVTGAITSAFVAAHAETQRRETSGDPLMQRLEHLSDQLEEIKAELRVMRR